MRLIQKLSRLPARLLLLLGLLATVATASAVLQWQAYQSENLLRENAILVRARIEMDREIGGLWIQPLTGDEIACLSLGTTAEEAFRDLSRFTTFSWSLVGVAAQDPPAAKVLQQVLTSPNANAAFKALLAGSGVTTEARLYALCGLYHTDRELFDATCAKWKNSNADVRTMTGCIGQVLPLGEVISNCIAPAHAPMALANMRPRDKAGPSP